MEADRSTEGVERYIDCRELWRTQRPRTPIREVQLSLRRNKRESVIAVFREPEDQAERNDCKSVYPIMK